jgi:hypothetical protein
MMTETTTTGFVERVVAATLAMPVDKPCPEHQTFLVTNSGERGVVPVGHTYALPCKRCGSAAPTGAIPNDQRARLLAAFGREHEGCNDEEGCWYRNSDGSGNCHGTGYVPRDFSVLDGDDLTQARVGLARSVCGVMGWTGDAKLEIEIWADGKAHAIVGLLEDWVKADSKDAAAFEATIRAMGGAG